jgi:RNA polymerase sigma-70 factor (ECF subfamily)
VSRSASLPIPAESHEAGSSEELLERIRREGPRVLDSVIRAESRRVERLLLRLLGPRRDLEDLVQTVFLEMCRSLPRYRGEGTVSAFLTGIAVRVARRTMRPPAWITKRSAMQAQNVHPGISPDRDASANEQVRRLRAALEKVSPKKRIAFVLWAIEGMEVEAIADTVGASVSATRGRIFHAQRQLKELARRDPYLKDLLQGSDHAG